LPRRLGRVLIQRGLDERAGRTRGDTGPDNRQEVVSKIRE
jgi:hypothetical protein